MQNLVKFIGRPETFKEWRPGVYGCTVMSRTERKQTLKWRQRKLELCTLLAQDNFVAWWLEPFLEHDINISRYDFVMTMSWAALVTISS